MEEKEKKTKIWFHADDFGVSVEQSERILACFYEGALNSVSILPNVPDLGGALALLEKADPKHRIRRVLHLNFVEGKPLAGADRTGLLVDDKGYFDKSFVKLFLWNYTADKKRRALLKTQLCAEIRAQLRAVAAEWDFGITAVDSHQHYHMIPMIFDCLLQVLSEEEFSALNIREIRIPVDPLRPVIFTCGRKKIRAVNFAKWLILKSTAKRNRRRLKKKGIENPVFFGILYTCEMKYETVSALLPAYRSFAQKRGAALELMLHPGSLSAEYELLDNRRRELWEFYVSDNRFYEAECLRLLKNGGVNYEK